MNDNAAASPQEPSPSERAVIATADVAAKQITSVAQARRYDFITDAVRAGLATVSIVATVLMLFQGIEISEAWWAIAGAVSTFYFSQRSSSTASS